MQIHQIERFTKVRIQRGKPPTASQVDEARTVVFLDKLRATLNRGEFKKQDLLLEVLLEEGFNSTDIASALIHQLQENDVAAVPKKLVIPRELPRAEPPALPVVTPPGKVKKSRRPAVAQTRIWINAGEAMGVRPIDVVNAVAEKTGLPGKVVGTIDIRDRHLFADVASQYADAIVRKLNRSELNGRKIKVKLA
jgi:ATP-dependent RNA helicase DeaD